jgi:hypothetical protein
MSDSGTGMSIITLEDGWTQEIKAKALETLENYLENGFDGKGKLFSNADNMITYIHVNNVID